MEKEKRLIGYARVSTDDQDLQRQIDALVRYGVKPERIIKEHKSGKDFNRPEWQKVMASMRSGDSVVVQDLDRLGRSLIGILRTVEEMEKCEVNLVVVNGGWDTRDPFGRAMFHFAGVFAELERNIASKRTRDGMEARKRAGVRFGRLHSIYDVPERLAVMQAIVDENGVKALDEMYAAEALEKLNTKDIKASKITSLETFNKWRRKGYHGLEIEA